MEASAEHIRAHCQVNGNYQEVEKIKCEHKEEILPHFLLNEGDIESSSGDGIMFLALPLTLCAMMIIMGVNSLANVEEKVDFGSVDTEFVKHTFHTVRKMITLMGTQS